MNRIYHINWDAIIALLLPTFLRGGIMIAWLNCLVKPIQQLHERFLVYRLDAIYRIEHTPQVFSMEKVLNEAFDPLNERIYIEDGEYRSQLYLFGEDEEQPIYLFVSNENQPVYIFGANDLSNSSVDFVVYLPLSFQSLFSPGMQNRIKLDSLINYYRLPDKTYQVKFI